MSKIELRRIDESNFIDCFNLKLKKEQERFVSHPIRSLAQAYVYYKQCTPFGVVADGEMVIGWDSHVPEFFWVAAQGGYGIQSAAGYSLLARNLLLAEPVDEQLLRQGVQTELLAPARLQK